MPITQDPQRLAVDALILNLRAYRTATVNERTLWLRRAAEAAVELRANTITSRGDVDWTGASFEYRKLMGEALGMAGYAPDEKPTVLAAMRYHISAALRERLGTDTVKDMGMRAESAKQRSTQSRRASAAMLAALKAGSTARRSTPTGRLNAALGTLGDVHTVDNPDTMRQLAAAIRIEITRIERLIKRA